MDTQSSEREKFRWQLALDIRKRADQSADIVRALLVAANGALLGYLLNVKFPNGIEVFSFILSCVSVVIVGSSWFLQKRKSLDRYSILIQQGLDAYIERAKSEVGKVLIWNMLYDIVSAILLVLAVSLAFSQHV